MTVSIAITLAVLVFVFAMLVFTKRSADMILLAGLSALLLTGVITAKQAFAGFGNEGLITVAVLFVVSSGIKETGAMAQAVQRILGRPTSMLAAQSRIILPTALLSGFLNNTPLVAMLLPVTLEWAKSMREAASRFMIPLSYAAVLGGLCTLIGTSTTVVVNGLLIDHTGDGMTMFEITKVGLPCALVGIAYLLATGRWLLPERNKPSATSARDAREYVLEMRIEDNSPLAGKTVEAAGLRHLAGLFLIEIDRDGETIPAVGPSEVLRAGDHLVFVGVLESVVDLQKIRGLAPSTDQVFKLDAPRQKRTLLEAVVSHTSPLAGKSIREGRFRTTYNAVVIAVSRNGERLRMKLGDIVLAPGDTLLLEASSEFLYRHRNSRDFYLVSRIEGFKPPRHEKAWIALAILGGMVALASFGVMSMLNAALLACGLMLVTRCSTGELARQSIDYRVLLAIAAAFGIGQAIESTGLATLLTSHVVDFVGGNPLLSLIAIYLVTNLFTELLTNNAAAVLMFPIGMATAGDLAVSPMPFVIAIAIAASAGFATPLGYQTHLMVYGPGGYRFTDFLKVGIPLNLLIATTSILLIPIFFPF